MKSKTLIILLIAFTLSIFSKVQAQVFQISANDHYTGVIGDFGSTDMSNSNAGYVNFANGWNTEFKYFAKNLGIGIRGTVTNYMRDNEAYQDALISQLEITSGNYYFTMNRSYWSIGGDIGISYVIKLSEKFQFEPYFYFGYRTLVTPLDEVVYLKNANTFTYRNNPILIDGISYTPGIKAQWNIDKHWGLNLYLEYEGASAYNGTKESVVYNAISIETTETDVSYHPQSVNFGLGLAFSFGKGLNSK